MGRRAKRNGLSSFDWIIGWVATELDIPMFAFSEVHCRGEARHSVDNEDLTFALTHPVYFENSIEGCGSGIATLAHADRNRLTEILAPCDVHCL